MKLSCNRSVRHLVSSAVIFVGLCSASFATPLPASARAEVEALFNVMQSSQCEFNRNGSWYSAAEAKAHLMSKLDYLEKNTPMQSTEQFIELAASKSSMSGKPYLVKCPNAQAQESQPWLTAQLQTIRKKSAAPKSIP